MVTDGGTGSASTPRSPSSRCGSAMTTSTAMPWRASAATSSTTEKPEVSGSWTPRLATYTRWADVASNACLTSGTWGNGLNNGGEQVVIALGTPLTRDVPEPGVLPLVAIGLAGMGGVARMRRHVRAA